MSGFDIFAWIVLIILVASLVAAAAGHVAKAPAHPHAQAVTVTGWLQPCLLLAALLKHADRAIITLVVRGGAPRP